MRGHGAFATLTDVSHVFLQRKSKLAVKRAQKINNTNNESKYCNLRLKPTVFLQLIREKILNFLQGKNGASSKDGAEKRGDCVRTSGHVTGYFVGGSRERLERA